MTAWTTLTLKTLTPLFSGDDPESGGDPIRVPSIRGALRFWFRAVAAGHGVTDLGELWKREERVFGSASKPSPIAMRIAGQPTVSLDKTPAWTSKAGIRYLLGQGLCERNALTRSFVPPGETFTVKIKLSGDDTVNQRFMLAVFAWLTYGGLGARVRRGFGRLQLTKLDGPCPAPWSGARVFTPRDAAGWLDLFAKAIPPDLASQAGWPVPLSGTPGLDDPLPTFPSLCPRWWGGRIVGHTKSRTWDEAMDAAGKAWREFRAPVEKGRKGQRTPEWTRAVWGDTSTRFPLAALGLPVGFFLFGGHNKRDPGTDYKAIVEPFDADGKPIRRASPVWLLPVPMGTAWGVVTHVFYADLLPPTARLRLEVASGGASKTLTKPTSVESAWDRWLDDAPRVTEADFR